MKLTVAQIPISDDITRNSQIIVRSIEAHDGSDDEILLLPEYSLSGPPTGKDSYEQISSGAFVQHIECIARTTVSYPRLHLFVPTLYAQEGVLFSALLYVFDGMIMGRHDKTVLTSQEKESLSAGQALTRFDVAGKKVAPLICAESNGSELSSLLAMQGTEIILHPSYPDMPLPLESRSSSTDQWDAPLTELVSVRARLRAFTEQYYHLSAIPAEMGYRSSIIAPDSQVVARAVSEEPTMISVRFDPQRFPLREHEVFLQRKHIFLKEIQRMKTKKPAD